MHATGFYNTPVHRGVPVQFLMVTPWPALAYLATWITLIVAGITCYVLAESNRSRDVRVAVTVSYIFIGAISVAAGIERAVTTGDAIEPCYHFFRGMLFWSVSGGMWFLEPYFLDVVMIAVTAGLLSCHVFVYGAKDMLGELTQPDSLIGLFSSGTHLIGCFAFLFVRRNLVMQAVKDLEPDREKYQVLWEALLSEEGVDDEVQMLRKTVRYIRQKVSNKDARQYNRARTSGTESITPIVAKSALGNARTNEAGAQRETGAWNSSRRLLELLPFASGGRQGSSGFLFGRQNIAHSPGVFPPLQQLASQALVRSLDVENKAQDEDSSMHDNKSFHLDAAAAARMGVDTSVVETVGPWITSYNIDKSSPVTSLDQLYSQACLLLPVLKAKVLELGSRHRGMLRRADGCCSEVDQNGIFGLCDGSVPYDQLQTTKVKSAMRCVDKADIAYKRNVSRLLDICRETIYFDNVRDLNDCLLDLTIDPSIEIVRIKSTMSSSLVSSADFSGYR
jgi:hypothetical protein